jgi:hypothetical protein
MDPRGALCPRFVRAPSFASRLPGRTAFRNMQAALSAAEMPSTELPSLRANEMAHVSACRQ